MIDIKFEINGRKVSPRNIGNALESAVLQSMQTNMINTIGAITCTEHDQKPSVTVKGRDLDHLKFEVSGCCDGVIKQVQSKLNS